MIVTNAEKADLPRILELQYAAYRSEAELYKNDRIEPLTQTLADLAAEFERKTILKAVLDGEIVGSVRAEAEDGTCRIGKLFVRPDLQGQGIGKKLMEEIEWRFSACKRFELFTGSRSERNLAMYGKLGYRPFRTVRVNERFGMVYLEKRTEGGEGTRWASRSEAR
ncbi:GNAT family N-acetyltransferase [Cohnella zeiphila]|uniref:GNAT family N-acetyltransferase n=1 Tax=Cohnella zeiphila TaxID=2761120 RepID=A0A7X0VWG6_9BACL|nr:GNAT family N-acetyltransferase [Cohnella zeiphila]MBB6732382.1 GNAT family N-acetyltransferase [Cohnella zeiphila]